VEALETGPSPMVSKYLADWEQFRTVCKTQRQRGFQRVSRELRRIGFCSWISLVSGEEIHGHAAAISVAPSRNPITSGGLSKADPMFVVSSSVPACQGRSVSPARGARPRAPVCSPSPHFSSYFVSSEGLGPLIGQTFLYTRETSWILVQWVPKVRASLLEKIAADESRLKLITTWWCTWIVECAHMLQQSV
jgi:hypothetical protein